MEVGWDHKIAAKLREEKLTQDQIGIVLGIIAEQRMNSDLQGYNTGVKPHPVRASEARACRGDVSP